MTWAAEHAQARPSTLRSNLLLASLAVGIWIVTILASRMGEPNDGLGPYVAFRGMVEGFTVKGGDELTRVSPLFPVLAWLPYAIFGDVIVSLYIVDAVAMGLLVLAACALCDRHAANPYVKALVAVNIPLLTRFAKMTAFMPADPSLCASAALMCAFTAAYASRHVLQAAASLAAVTLSPIGIAAPLSAAVGALRSRINPTRIAALYAPPVAIWCAVQWWARGGVGGAVADFMPSRLLASLELWREPIFVTLAAATLVTAGGGLMIPLLRRPSCVATLSRTTPEAIALFGVVAINVVSTGSLTVWGFLLPVWVLLWTAVPDPLGPREARMWCVAATLVTLATQIPFAYSSSTSYDATVHPYAAYRGMASAPAAAFMTHWLLPIVTLVVALTAVVTQSLTHLEVASARARQRTKVDPYLVAAVLLVALGFVLRPNHGPAVDENDHLDQIVRFAHGDWSRNAALTMLPGFHALVALFVAPVGATEASVRFVVFGLSLVAVLVFHALARQLEMSTAGIRTLQFTLLPVLFQQFFLIYTDVTSLLFVLLMLLLTVRKRYAAAGLVGFAALLIRQDNIVWLAFAVVWAHVREHGWQWRPFTEMVTRYATFIASGCAFLVFVAVNHGEIALGYDSASHPVGFFGGNVFFLLFLSGFIFAPLWWSYRAGTARLLSSMWLAIGVGLFAAYWFGFVVTHPHNRERTDYFLSNAVLMSVTATAARRLLAFVSVAVAAIGFAVAPMQRGWRLLLPFSVLFLVPEWLIAPRYYLIPWSLFIVARDLASPPSERLQTLVFAVLSACAFVFVNGQWGWI